MSKAKENGSFERHYSPMLGRVWQLCEQVGLTQAEAAETLTNEGFRTPGGKPIHQPAVCRALKLARERRRRGTLLLPANAPEQAPKPAPPMTAEEYLLEVERERNELANRVIVSLRKEQDRIYELARSLENVPIEVPSRARVSPNPHPSEIYSPVLEYVNSRFPLSESQQTE